MTIGAADFRSWWLQVLRALGAEDYSSCWLQELMTAGTGSCRTLGLQDFRAAGAEDCRGCWQRGSSPLLVQSSREKLNTESDQGTR